MSESHRKVLSILVGSPLRQIGRAADLLWMHFGQWCEVPSRRGGTRQVGQWALHVQTDWRFVRESEIVMGISEMYHYADDGSQFDWNKDGESRFDGIAVRLNQEFEAEMEIVTDVTCDDVGGFSLLLKSGLRFDVFPCVAFTSPDFEFWRFFEPATENDHYVVSTIEGRAKG